MMYRFSFLALLVLLCSCVSLGQTPSATKVAIVPVLNLSGETWEEAKVKQADRGDEELSALFRERSFQVIDPAKVKAAVADLKIDLTDEEQQKRETLYQIGEAVEADLVVFVVITDVDQRKVTKFLVSSTEGKAKMKAWLLNVKEKKPVFSAKTFEGASKSGGLFEVGEKGSHRKQLAVANGIRKLFVDEYLKPYPVTEKIERSKVGR